MKIQHQIMMSAIAAVMLTAGAATSARAQTVVNLTNLDPTESTGFSSTTAGNLSSGTSLDLLNTTTALSNGGLFGGAVSNQTQQATNQLNTIGLTSLGAAAPVVLGNQTPITGTPTVTINTIASAYNAVGSGTVAVKASGTYTIGAAEIPSPSAGSGSLIVDTSVTVGGKTYNIDAYTAPIAAAAGVSAVAGSITLTEITAFTDAAPTGSAIKTWLGLAGTPSASLTSGVLGVAGSPSIAAGTSTTINNINAAISGGVNQIVGAPPTLNNTYTGGYGPTAGNVQVGGSQIGVNTVNGVGAAFAAGTAVTLSQLPGAPSPIPAGTGPGAAASLGSPIIQGGALNMSTVNTLLAYTGAGAASVNGSGSTAGAPGAQTAINTFNTATLVGDIGVAAQQKADGLNSLQTAFQSVNRALAYSAGATSANVDPSVTNLNQTAAVGVNALNLLAGSTGATTLSGTQTTGYNTVSAGAPYALSSSGVPTGSALNPTVGATPIAIVTNQIVASTFNASGFLPSGGNSGDTTVGGVTTAGPMTSAWLALTQQVGADGAPTPMAGNVGSLPIYSRLTGVDAAMGLGSGTVAIGNVGQSISLTNNTVSAGTTAAPVAVTFGPAGFAQTAGSIGIATNADGLNNASATTGVGASSLNAVTQAFQSANNTFQGTGNLSGALSQGATGLNFGAGAMVTPNAAPGGGDVLKTIGGSGQSNVPGSAGPYELGLNSSPSPLNLNTAIAGITYGTASVTGVTQSGNTFANVAQTAGVIDPGAASTLSQTMGPITGYGSTTTVGTSLPTNFAGAIASQGNSALSTVNQALSLTANAVSGNAGVNGSVAQSSGDTAGMQPTNVLVSQSSFQGSAALASNVQANYTTLNSIASTGALGSSTSPAAFSQQASATNTGVAAFDASNPPAAGSPTTFSLPSNAAVVVSNLGAGGSATSNGLTQAANLNVNAISGGSAAGTGITGNATQTSVNRSSTIANLATATSMGGFPADSITTNQPGSVMSGNATMLNTAQSAAQSLNTMSLAGANNGILNQATFGYTNQSTGNQIATKAWAGYAVTTGAQLATNAVNVISAR